MFASVCWGRCCGFGTNSSPVSCTCSLALDLKTGLGSAVCPLVAHELEVSIDHRSGEMLHHKVCRIIGSENMLHFELMKILLLLDPRGADIDVTEFAGTFAVRNCQCGAHP